MLSDVSLGAADRRSWRQLPLLLALFLAAVVGVLQTGASTLPATPAPAALSPAAPPTAEPQAVAHDTAAERSAVQSPAEAHQHHPREIPAALPAVGAGAERALSDQDVHPARTPRGPPLRLV